MSKALAARVRGVEHMISLPEGLITMAAVAVMPLRLMVKRLPLSFSTVLFKLMALPVSVKAEAPESKYKEPKALLAVKLLTGAGRMLPAKSNRVAVPTVGAVPPQLAGVVMLLSVPPPFHTFAAEADRAAPSNRVAQIGRKDFLDEGLILFMWFIKGIGVGQLRFTAHAGLVSQRVGVFGHFVTISITWDKIIHYFSPIGQPVGVYGGTRAIPSMEPPVFSGPIPGARGTGAINTLVIAGRRGQLANRPLCKTGGT